MLSSDRPSRGLLLSFDSDRCPAPDEFFRHLPGIFTGIGIIGTFAGLIAGLSAFTVSGEPSSVNRSISALIDDVRTAFFVSLVAITLAMLVTTVEKFAINGLLARVSELCANLDGLFDAGAGEEPRATRYLLRGKRDETTQLKDAIVADLTEVLERISSTQIAAMREGAQLQRDATAESARVLAEEMGRRIQETFAAPLEQVAARFDADARAGSARRGADGGSPRPVRLSGGGTLR